MKIVFEKASIRLNRLRINVAIYPEKNIDAIYPRKYKEQFDEKGKSLGWFLNPVIKHIFVIPERCTLTDIECYIRDKFNKDVCATLNDLLNVPLATTVQKRLSPFIDKMRPMTTTTVLTKDKADLIGSFDWLIKDIEYPVDLGGKILPTPEGTIDIGFSGPNNATHTTENTRQDRNTASGTGTITSVTVQCGSDVTGAELGIFTPNGSNWDCDDTDAYDEGPFTMVDDTAQTGLSLLVKSTSDLIGLWWTGGSMGYVSNDGTGYSLTSGDQIPCTNQSFTVYSPRDECIYGTGTEPEPGGGASVSVVMQMMSKRRMK